MSRNDTNTTERFTGILTYTVIECGGCGVSYALSDQYIHARRQDHKNWTCPNGCNRHYPEGSSDAEKAKAAQALAERRLEWANTAKRAAQEQATAAHRQATAYKGHNTRLRKRAAAGLCPCCNRSFQDLARHMGTKHPEFGES
jgi:hypothetical protein